MIAHDQKNDDDARAALRARLMRVVPDASEVQADALLDRILRRFGWRDCAQLAAVLEELAAPTLHPDAPFWWVALTVRIFEESTAGRRVFAGLSGGRSVGTSMLASRAFPGGPSGLAISRGGAPRRFTRVAALKSRGFKTERMRHGGARPRAGRKPAPGESYEAARRRKEAAVAARA